MKEFLSGSELYFESGVRTNEGVPKIEKTAGI